jgi:hypothetical protein
MPGSLLSVLLDKCTDGATVNVATVRPIISTDHTTLSPVRETKTAALQSKS